MRKHPYQDPDPSTPAPANDKRCPRCGAANLARVQRRAVDHLLGLFVSIRRYRCTHVECGWEGNLRVKSRRAR